MVISSCPSTAEASRSLHSPCVSSPRMTTGRPIMWSQRECALASLVLGVCGSCKRNQVCVVPSQQRDRGKLVQSSAVCTIIRRDLPGVCSAPFSPPATHTQSQQPPLQTGCTCFCSVVGVVWDRAGRNPWVRRAEPVAGHSTAGASEWVVGCAHPNNEVEHSIVDASGPEEVPGERDTGLVSDAAKLTKGTSDKVAHIRQ